MERRDLWLRLVRLAIAALLVVVFVVVMVYAFPFVEILILVVTVAGQIWPPLAYGVWIIAVPVLFVAWLVAPAIVYVLIETVLAEKEKPSETLGEDTKTSLRNGHGSGVAGGAQE